MFYFIPSWYKNEEIPWNSRVEPWFRAYQRLQFDDTVAQLQMFTQQKQPSQVLTLNYDPKLALFLRARGLNTVKQVNLFDELQGIDSDYQQNILNYTEFSWPEQAEFAIGTFNVVVYVHDEVYAVIDFDETGHLSMISRYEQGQVSVVYLFDCRGFLSSVTDVAKHQRRYLDVSGAWVFAVDTQTNRVEVNAAYATRFEQLSYTNLEQLIVERLRHKLVTLDERDVLVVSAAEANLRVISQIGLQTRLVYSFFQNRCQLDDTNLVRFQRAQLLVVDTLNRQKQLKQLLPDYSGTIKFMPPYDTTLRLGHSQRTKYLKLYLNIDNINDAELRHAITQIVQVMVANPLVTLTLASIEDSETIAQRLDGLVKQILAEQNVPKDRIIYRLSERQDDTNEFDVDKKVDEQGINVLALKQRRDLFTELDDTRLVLDLGKNPVNYLALAALSAGIPQINCTPTAYVTDQENGRIIADISQLKQALFPYLNNLAYWNKAMMATVNKISEYASENIVADWQQLVGVSDE